MDKATLPAAATRTVDYTKDVQPILSRHCYECHGPDIQESSFRLDQKGAALRGGDSGDKPLVPGKSAESPLIKAVAGQLPDLKMPPKGDRLTAEEIGILRAWVDQGLSWPDAGGRSPRSCSPRGCSASQESLSSAQRLRSPGSSGVW